MNRRSLPCILAAVGLFFTVGDAAASSKPSEADLAAITTRGVLLAEYDTAAWQATDAVKAGHPVGGRMRRYIAQKTEAGWVVDFGRLNEVRDKFLVAYEAVQTASMPFTIQAGRTKAESTVQKYLGHKSILTTQRYAHLAPKHLMAGINRLDPKKKRATSTRTSTEEIREIARAAKA